MNDNTNISDPYTTTPLIVTISDLKDDYFDGIELTDEQKTALKNFDRLRLKTLSESVDDNDFQRRYFELQRKENTEDYKHFI